MEEAYHLLITGNKDKKISAQTYLKIFHRRMRKGSYNELKDSYQQILDYSGIDEEKAQEMQRIMLDFVNLKDRLSIDDVPDKLERSLLMGIMSYIRQYLLKPIMMNMYQELLICS